MQGYTIKFKNIVTDSGKGVAVNFLYSQEELTALFECHPSWDIIQMPEGFALRKDFIKEAANARVYH